VITPGTEFMARAAEALRAHFARKISADPNWSQLAVILSDSCVPGEGEHKIMEFIRHQRTQEGYNPNAHMAVYGLVPHTTHHPPPTTIIVVRNELIFMGVCPLRVCRTRTSSF
jgi:hypothetical protein